MITLEQNMQITYELEIIANVAGQRAAAGIRLQK